MSFFVMRLITLFDAARLQGDNDNTPMALASPYRLLLNSATVLG